MSVARQCMVDLVDYAHNHPRMRIPYAFLGVVGNSSHTTGYHLGMDRLRLNKGWADYSARMTRDRAGIGMDEYAAMGFDIVSTPGYFPDHDAWLKWLTDAFLAGEAWTADIREIIGSFDGVNWYGWVTDQSTGRRYRTAANSYGDSSHRTHTHVSFLRDSVRRAKTWIFERFFNKPQEDDDMLPMQIEVDPRFAFYLDGNGEEQRIPEVPLSGIALPGLNLPGNVVPWGMGFLSFVMDGFDSLDEDGGVEVSFPEVVKLRVAIATQDDGFVHVETVTMTEVGVQYAWLPGNTQVPDGAVMITVGRMRTESGEEPSDIIIRGCLEIARRAS